jgi:tRNA/rRNA methyltransferase
MSAPTPIAEAFAALARPAIVLVSPKGPDNVGAVARAMKNFGLSDLRIVAPRCKLKDALVMAVHAGDLIEQARLFDTLAAAVAECDLVAATTARERRDHSQPLPPRAAAPLLSNAADPAIVFGREESGLTNEELDLAHIFMHIPTDSQYLSMNLAQSLVVVAYELMLYRQERDVSVEVVTTKRRLSRLERKESLASRQTLEGMYAHLLEYMLEVGYTDQQRQGHGLRRYRQILDRAELNVSDVALLRGLLAQGMWASRKARGAGIPGSVPWPREVATTDDAP